ncbi:MAG: UTP--glucose-1-phosphate uridylyltransferase [Candidatus Dependentiae bacterium]|nr:UTP--glucose-1-phosphate uridylyltransferase [Candidatus Dependentiae bacterium]
MDMKISKLIIPAAGIGSRFLPITKSIPKEMLPLSNKPAIQYIVQEGLDAKIDNMLVVLSPEKGVIIDYFTRNQHLEDILALQGKSSCLDDLNKLIATAKFQYFIQNKPQGVANALLHAQPAIENDEFFAVALPDDIIFGVKPEIGYLAKIAREHQAMVIGVLEVPYDQISAYGVVAPGLQISHDIFEIESLVEKPQAAAAPSNLAIVGRYIFHSSLFAHIPLTPVAGNGEILLPDTINLMIKKGFKVLAVKIKGQRFDTGTPQGWLEFIVKHNKID